MPPQLITPEENNVANNIVSGGTNIKIRNKRTGEIKEIQASQAQDFGLSPVEALSRFEAQKEITRLEEGREVEEPKGATEAKLIASVKSGLTSAKRIEETLFAEGGLEKLKGGIKLFGATTPATPFGRGLEADVLNLADAVLRLRTGAAAPEEEVKRFAKIIGPSLLDPESVKRQKIDTAKLELEQALISVGIDPKELLGEEGEEREVAATIGEEPTAQISEEQRVAGEVTPDNLITNRLVDEGKLPESQREVFPQQSVDEQRIAGQAIVEEPEPEGLKENPWVEFFLGDTIRFSEDIGAGLALKGKGGQELRASQERAIESANQLFDKSLEVDDPEQRKRMIKLSNEIFERVGMDNENIQKLASKDIEQSALKRGLGVGVEIGALLEAPSLLIGIKNLTTRTAGKAISKVTTRDIAADVVRTGEKIERATPKSFLGRKQAEAAAKLSKVKPKVDLLVKAGDKIADIDPDVAKLWPKTKEFLGKIDSIPKLLDRMQTWGGQTYLRGGGVKSAAKATLLDNLYKAGTEILKTQAPEVYKYRSLLRFSFELPKVAMKTLWRLTLGRVLTSGV